MESVAYIILYNANLSGVKVLQNFSADKTSLESTESSTNMGSLSAPGGTISIGQTPISELDSIFLPSDNFLWGF
ncbi:hypothetical protein [Lyngbya sp. PCC 8106]|uniref:hypothetical protein n=1 Tax=Lyngbya sp. (strain PCC 8106) TaxID=313612 RepID=UPI000586D477|nr:hypothetical protein [Lyngbya sp. PCC 8106]